MDIKCLDLQKISHQFVFTYKYKILPVGLVVHLGQDNLLTYKFLSKSEALLFIKLCSRNYVIPSIPGKPCKPSIPIINQEKLDSMVRNLTSSAQNCDVRINNSG